MSHARAGHPHRRWRVSAKKPHTEGVRNDINVTPLVDVMLVLLIIFMLMSMLMGRGQEVKIPRAKYISSQPDMLQPIVSIDEKGNLSVEKTTLGKIDDAVLHYDPKSDAKAPDLLLKMDDSIKKVWTKKPRGNGRVYIKAHQDLTYAQVAPVLMYLNKALGLEGMDLAVGETSKD